MASFRTANSENPWFKIQYVQVGSKRPPVRIVILFIWQKFYLSDTSGAQTVMVDMFINIVFAAIFGSTFEYI